MPVTQFTTNSHGEFLPHPLKKAAYAGGIVTASADTARKNTGFLGCGVALTGSSCYTLSRLPRDERKELLKTLYTDKGLALAVGRLCVGASDYAAELYTYDDEENDLDLARFSVDRDKDYILPVIREILDTKSDLYLFASPWSPPGWMKTGGSICGGHMRERFLDVYARYIVRFLEAYAKEGVPVRALTPQNEPETQQFGRMPACVWNPETEAAFAIVLRKALSAAGLSHEIWLCDHSFAYVSRVAWQLANVEGLREAVNAAAFHYYDGSIEQTAALKEQFPDLALHFTEGGPRLYDHYDTDWCKWGEMLCKTLNNGYRSFTGWNLALDETGGPNIGPFFCGGLVTVNSKTGEITKSGQYKALRHVSPFVGKTDTAYPVSFSPNGGNMFAYPHTGALLTGTFVERSDGSAALILVNPGTDKAQTQFFRDGAWWYIELLPDTLSTVVFD